MNGLPQLRLVTDEPTRRSDGHRLGDHGRRCPAPIKRVVTEKLVAYGRPDQPLPKDLLEQCVGLAGVSVRTLERWRTEGLRAEAKGTVDDLAVDTVELYKANRVLEKGARTGFIPTKDLLSQLKPYPSWHDAYRTLSKVPNHPLASVSRSTFYAGMVRVHDGVRAGLIHGVPAMRKHQMSLPRQTVGQVNDRWSVDLYTIKVQVRDVLAGIDEETSLKLLMVRDEWDGMPRAYRRFIGTPTAADLVALVGEAVIGWEHDGVHVHGPARFLRFDQGTQMMAAETLRKLNYVGMVGDPTGSYWPDGNGGHEREHRDYGLEFQKVPGSTQGPEDRTGAQYDKRTYATLAEVDEALARIMDDARFRHRPRTDRHAGRTRFELYRDCVDEGLVADDVQLTDENIAALTIPVADRISSARSGVTFRRKRYLSAHWSEVGYEGDVTVASLYADDGSAPETLYAHTPDGRFLALLYREDIVPPADIARAVELTRARLGFVETEQKQRRADRRARRNLAPLPEPTGAVPRPAIGSLDHEVQDASVLEAIARTPELKAVLADPALLTALRRLTDDDIARLHGPDDHATTGAAGPPAQSTRGASATADGPSPAIAAAAPSTSTERSAGPTDTNDTPDDLTARLAAARAKKEKK